MMIKCARIRSVAHAEEDFRKSEPSPKVAAVLPPGQGPSAMDNGGMLVAQPE